MGNHQMIGIQGYPQSFKPSKKSESYRFKYKSILPFISRAINLQINFWSAHKRNVILRCIDSDLLNRNANVLKWIIENNFKRHPKTVPSLSFRYISSEFFIISLFLNKVKDKLYAHLRDWKKIGPERGKVQWVHWTYESLKAGDLAGLRQMVVSKIRCHRN